MNEALVILSGYMEPNTLRARVPRGTDLLAFDLPAMQACGGSGVPFATPGHLYSVVEFRRSFGEALTALESVLAVIDRQYAREIGFPRTFRSNLYAFAVYLADLHFLSGVARALRARYRTVQFWTAGSEYVLAQPAEAPMTCDILGCQLVTKTDPRAYNVRRLYEQLEAPMLVLLPDDRREGSSILIPISKRHAYLLRPENWPLLLQKLRRRLGWAGNAGTGTCGIIWCVQDGYEVAALKRYLPEFTFVQPLAHLAEHGTPLPGAPVAALYAPAAADLAERYPQWASEISALLQAYHEGVACRIPAVMERLEQHLAGPARPQCALYSIGALTPLEAVYAWMLNQNKIPIFTFQHGGSNLYFNTPLTSYVEFNREIDQTTFCVSRFEAEFLRKSNPGLQLVEAGAIHLHEWHSAQRTRTRRSGNGRVLLIQGRYPSEAWKNLFCSEGEDRTFEKHVQLFDSAARHGLRVDVKLYPDSIRSYAAYFRRLLHRFGMKRSRLFYGVPAERIAEKYGLVVMEYIGTALNAFAMLLDRPVIYYLAEPELINPAVAEAFYQRHYVAHDGKDLDRLFDDFRRGVLRSKHDPRFVDQFVYPLDGIDPGRRIGEHIRRSLRPRGGTV